MFNSDVAAVGVAVEGGASAEDHFVEDAGEGSGNVVAVDAMRVQVLKVVGARTAHVLHNEDAALCPEHLGDDDGCVADVGEILACSRGVLAFLAEVKFLGERLFHFLGQPGEVVLWEPVAEGLEGETGESEVELGPFVEGGVLDFDGDFFTGGADDGAVDLGERCGTDGQRVEGGEVGGEVGAFVGHDHLFDRLVGGDGAFVLQRDERVTPLAGEEVIQTAEMLAELYKNRAVLLEGPERAFGAPQMACFERLAVAFVVVLLQGVSVAGLSVSTPSASSEEVAG